MITRIPASTPWDVKNFNKSWTNFLDSSNDGRGWFARSGAGVSKNWLVFSFMACMLGWRWFLLFWISSSAITNVMISRWSEEDASKTFRFSSHSTTEGGRFSSAYWRLSSSCSSMSMSIYSVLCAVCWSQFCYVLFVDYFIWWFWWYKFFVLKLGRTIF